MLVARSDHRSRGARVGDGCASPVPCLPHPQDEASEDSHRTGREAVTPTVTSVTAEMALASNYLLISRSSRGLGEGWGMRMKLNI